MPVNETKLVQQTQPMAYWNYRFVLKEGFYSIHEVYYDANRKVVTITQEPVCVGGDTLKEAIKDYRIMSRALLRPPLDYKTQQEIVDQ